MLSQLRHMTHSNPAVQWASLLTRQCSCHVKQLHMSVEGSVTKLVASVQVVGLLTLQFTTDLQQLQSHFDLSDVLDAAQHDPLTGFADMEVCCMNPIFAHRCGHLQDCLPLPGAILQPAAV